ncbi:aminotransferase class I/II-fold pyridoxal phosphate-dependent enzyme, partial [Rothia kristinae]
MAEGVYLYREGPNLVVLRTFSKAAGRAGLRVGYSIAHPEITRSLRVSATPFAVSTLAESAAFAAIAHQEEIDEQVRWIVAERERIVAAPREDGGQIPATGGDSVGRRP